MLKRRFCLPEKEKERKNNFRKNNVKILRKGSPFAVSLLIIHVISESPVNIQIDLVHINLSSGLLKHLLYLERKTEM